MVDGKLSKIVNHPWLVGISASVIGGLILAVIFSEKFRAGAGGLFGILGRTLVFKLGVPVWIMILVAGIVVYLLVRIINARSKKKEEKPAFLDYIEAEIWEVLRRWDYWGPYQEKYKVTNVKSFCPGPDCGCELLPGRDDIGKPALLCPDCTLIVPIELTDRQMKKIIEKNIREKYPDWITTLKT